MHLAVTLRAEKIVELLAEEPLSTVGAIVVIPKWRRRIKLLDHSGVMEAGNYTVNPADKQVGADCSLESMLSAFGRIDMPVRNRNGHAV
ncbi:hypothetical protein BH23ACT12_BH23ACT12_02770 [soil metagenome]